MKKVVVILVLLLLLFSVHIPTHTIYAASLSDNIIIQLTETHTNDQIDINVKLVTNTGISAMTLELEYNKNVFEYYGYERGAALSELDLMSTDLSSDASLPVRFNWFNQNLNSTQNDFSTGNMLQLHFTLKPNSPTGEYKIGFRYNRGDIVYIDKNNPNPKSAIISKVAINIEKDKIIDTEIIETQPNDNNVFLIVGITVFAVSACVATALVVIKRIKVKKGKENWLEI